MQVSRRVGAVVTSVAALAVVACGILTGPVYASVVVHVCRGAGRQAPDPGAVLNELYGAAMTSGCDLWAVGEYAGGSRVVRRPLIEHWNGARWAVQRSRVTAGVLTAVAAVSPGDAWAVGRSGHRALIERWNGRSWRSVPSDTPRARF